jgi:hypothetical protein
MLAQEALGSSRPWVGWGPEDARGTPGGHPSRSGARTGGRDHRSGPNQQGAPRSAPLRGTTASASNRPDALRGRDKAQRSCRPTDRWHLPSPCRAQRWGGPARGVGLGCRGGHLTRFRWGDRSPPIGDLHPRPPGGLTRFPRILRRCSLHLPTPMHVQCHRVMPTGTAVRTRNDLLNGHLTSDGRWPADARTSRHGDVA